MSPDNAASKPLVLQASEGRRGLRAACGRVIKSLIPSRYWIHLQARRAWNHQLQWLRAEGLLDLSKRFLESNGASVRHGPFAGMRYPVSSILNRHSVPFLLGSYESELHAVIDEALRTNYQLIVDVGCAEGYYAVGFALKGKSAVVAFDADARELKRCREMARLNNVEDRITLRSWCSSEELQDLTKGTRCFVLSDCEGYETELFDEATVLALRMSHVLVEIHGDAYEPLVERFSKTHSLQTFVASLRSAEDYPELGALNCDPARALSEYRPPGQRWLYARPHEVQGLPL
jgi:predicted RNA methylase